MTLQDPLNHERLAARRRRMVVASTTVLWVVAFICAALIATTIGEAHQRAQIEALIQTTHAQNLALEKDITKTEQALNVARSPAEIEREALRWGYQRP
ncbi:MAG: hypothetical protein ACLQUY_25650 [Ktedonobacterales bacterium]